ncbi:MAG: hypothetical protein F6K22_08330 [Okeania sp. SIO2F4]|uniref:hypothetical protein n=1 Tax=Okeania sp. SIO2F4 TaxID=2607790 RepID=UPI00142CE5C6|nr:hypothetical protein [Okeania sp. SIO2F4]NES02852.1 hypothetical protein [Okeania sp. SIO2F4]
MIDPFSLTIAAVGAGGTWVVAYAWARDEKNMSHSEAVKHANKVTGTTMGVLGSFAGMVTGVDSAIHNDSNNSTNS